MQTFIALNRTFHDSCIKAPEIDDDERCRLLGVPLTLEKLAKAGVEPCTALCIHLDPSLFEQTSVVRQGLLVDDDTVTELEETISRAFQSALQKVSALQQVRLVDDNLVSEFEDSRPLITYSL